MGLEALELTPRVQCNFGYSCHACLQNWMSQETGQNAMGRGGERASDLLNSTLKIISH
jgi:hypothetical protein